jgi:AraC-like DNA-binding protein
MIFLDEIVRTSKTRIEVEKKSLRDFYMREALNYIEGNYMHDLSIEEIADASGLNRSYFSRIFKDYYGMTASQFRKGHGNKTPKGDTTVSDS